MDVTWRISGLFVILCILLVHVNAVAVHVYSGTTSVLRDPSGAYSRQGSIDEFIASRPTTEKYNQQEPCIPVQFLSRRNRRSPHHRKKKVYAVYPIVNNVIPITNVARPPYNTYGGYYCANQRPMQPIQQPIHNNLYNHFTNVFGGLLGTNSNGINASPPSGSDERPVREDNNQDVHSNGVIIDLNSIFLTHD